MPQLIEQALRNEIAELKVENERLRQEVAEKTEIAQKAIEDVAVVSGELDEAREVARDLWISKNRPYRFLESNPWLEG